jgi:hypothetical protein
MWTTILGLAGTALSLVLKLFGGGSSNVATAGDQKAVDEAAAVKAAGVLLDSAAQPVDAKGALDAKKF